MKTTKFFFIFIFLLLISSFSLNALNINEIMYNPLGNDNNNEYIELYSSEKINLTGFIVEDASSQDILEFLQLSNSGYYLIVEEGFNYSGINASIYSAGAAIGNNLNVQDSITIKNRNNSLLAQYNYTNLASEGNSLCLISNLWQECNPTPGYQNKAIEEEITIATSQTCDWEINLNLNQLIFNDKTNFSVNVERIIGEEQNVTVKGEILDLFANKIKTYNPWTEKRIVNHGTKRYSPSLKPGTYKISFWLENLYCLDEDTSNNQISRLIAVSPEKNEESSFLEIEQLYLGNDHKVEWGDLFTFKINVYKGNETKTAISFWAEKDGEKISKTTKLIASEKYQLYPLTIPIQLEANCDGKKADGSAMVVVEGFDLHTEKEFEIKGIDSEICKTYNKEIKSVQKELKKEKEEEIKRIETSLISTASSDIKTNKNSPSFLNSKINPDYGGITVYESNSVKTKKIISYLLIATFALLSLVLVIKK